jgi:hypothetical protein
MGYRAAEKPEIMHLVEHSSLSVRGTLAQLGLPRNFLPRYQRYCVGRDPERWPVGAASSTTPGAITRVGNLTPADVYSGRGPTVLARRQTITHQTIELRRRLHQQAVA